MFGKTPWEIPPFLGQKKNFLTLKSILSNLAEISPKKWLEEKLRHPRNRVFPHFGGLSGRSIYDLLKESAQKKLKKVTDFILIIYDHNP